jgi:TolA-binding protein
MYQFNHEMATKYALLCVVSGILALTSPALALARDKDHALPPLDPNSELSDAKLNPTVAKTLADAITLYNSSDFNGALAKIAEAKAVPGHLAYDDFQINNLTMEVAAVAKDFATSASADEAMAASPALTDANKNAVYDGGLVLNTAVKHYWRAIQYGELMSRENILGADSAAVLAAAYFNYGSFADAERVAQAALDSGTAPDKMRKKLLNIVNASQVKEGKVASTLSVGDDLLNAFAQGLVAGTTGQAVPPPIQQPTTDQQAAASQAAEQQAQQQAAAEVLAADPAFERIIYADLIDRGARVSPVDKQRAGRIFKAAYASGQKEDYTSAESGFRNGLDIDPTNAEANYWYAYCLGHSGSETLQALDYLTRAVTFGGNDSGGTMAQSALKDFASPTSSSQN